MLLEFLRGVAVFWHYVIISIGGKEVKISNVILAIIVVVFVLRNYRNFVSFISNKIVSSKYKHEKELIERIISISFGLIFVITILQVANVPLDTFAFLGGALALGVGLGVQNLINNMLSSLIITIEKPLKLGDYITVDGTSGKVSHIGDRCITLTSSTNAKVFIPSSSILQTKLTNWTKAKSLNSETKIKISKTRDVNEVLNIIEEGIKNGLSGYVDSFNLILSSVSISYYVCSLSYAADVENDLKKFKHHLALYLIDKLGSDIIIEHIDNS